MRASFALARGNTAPCRARETQVEKSNVSGPVCSGKRWISQPMARRTSRARQPMPAAIPADYDDGLVEKRVELFVTENLEG